MKAEFVDFLDVTAKRLDGLNVVMMKLDFEKQQYAQILETYGGRLDWTVQGHVGRIGAVI